MAILMSDHRQTSVLVTGGAGYVGSHACKALAQAGFRPVVYDDLSRGHRDAVRWGPLVEGDVRDASTLEDTMRRFNISAILHFAGRSEVGESMIDPLLYHDVNTGGAISLARAARSANVDKLIFSSTCAIYGLPESVPITEAEKREPINPYGVSKLAAEQIFTDAERAYGLRTISLRYFNAAGADPEGELGERHDPETHLIPLAIRAGLPGSFTLKIMGGDYPTPDGTAIRDYVHVSDLATAHVTALKRLLGGGEGGAFNLGVGRGFSVREIVQAVEKASGVPIRQEPAPRRAGDPPILIADPSAARHALAWNPVRTSIDDIVGDAFRWEVGLQDAA